MIAADSRRGTLRRRAWRTFYAVLIVSSLLEAVVRYPNLSFHGFLGPLPWPIYLGFAAGWTFLWWNEGHVSKEHPEPKGTT